MTVNIYSPAVYQLTCDICGAKARLPGDPSVLPAGWSRLALYPAGMMDYCPLETETTITMLKARA